MQPTKLALAIAVVSQIACSRRPPLVSVDAASISSAAGVAPGDWPTFNRTLAGDRFSPLAEIDRSNVSRLGVVCRYALPEVTALQTGPIVVGGVMYFTTDTISYAIDAGMRGMFGIPFGADPALAPLREWRDRTYRQHRGGRVVPPGG